VKTDRGLTLIAVARFLIGFVILVTNANAVEAVAEPRLPTADACAG